MPAHLIAEEGPHRGLVLHFTEGEDWVIGRDPDVADFVIEDSTVSRQHARITKQPQGIFLQNLSHTNPILINGEEPEGRVLLKEGDKIQIGHTVFLFSEEDPPNRVESSPSNKKEKEADGYDAIFGDLEEPPPPSREKEEPEEQPHEKVPLKSEEDTAYDTIFEDVEEPAELPFNLLQPAALLLKVISGPNAGAEISIEKEHSYVIGKDPNSCDIVFQDLSVSRNHARISVDAERKVELEDLGSKNGTLVNGQPILGQVAITPQDLISLGTTVFLLIDREAPQETIYSSVMPSYEAHKADEDSEEREELVAASFETDWKKKPLPTKHLVLGIAFLATFLIVSLSFFSLFKSETVESLSKEPMSQIKDALAKYPEVQFSYNPGSGKIFVVGHVLTAVDYQEMNFKLSQIPFILSVENTVVIDELVWKMNNDILSSFPAWRGVNIHSTKAGSFSANGFVQTNEDAASLWEYLTGNFPYLDKLQNNIAVEENVTAFVQGLLVSKGFGSVAFQVSGGELILTGGYAAKREEEFKKTVKDLNAVKGISSVKNFAMPSAANSLGIDITQQYQVTGSSLYDGHAYSVILNGKIYSVGDSVDGMEITTIDRTSVQLEKGGLKYRIDYR
ncbi:MAG TPA: type III secretion system inner membrane ring subunit SctD [Chlamydiales bacterium]|jgi:type III secretion system YscD/HrpQ family protein|nr:type III secretion system inner membrane ring subunit SctD [Chlamydiales bacterium]